MKQTIVFKQWLPDQADLDRDGLIVAKNVLPLDDGFTPFKTLDTSAGTYGANVDSAGFAYFGGGYTYAHNVLNHTLSSAVNTAAFTARGTMNGNVCFAQFDDLMIMASDQTFPYKHTIGSSSNISTLASVSLPTVGCIGVVNRFVVIGDLDHAAGTSRPSTIRWSAIDDPTNWPTALSATATATQSGEQDLNGAFGDVVAIHGGDQFAIIMQRNAVIRMTYVGPPVVFQFDTIDTTKGLAFNRGSIKVGNLVYFISDSGICRTDGVTVQEIGKGKVDRYLFSTMAIPSRRVINCGHDPSTGLIYFGYSTDVLSFDIDRIIIYNPTNDSFTFANQDLEMFVTPIQGVSSPSVLLGFSTGSNAILGLFQATAGSAVLESSDYEVNPGGRAFLSGIKPNVESSGTAPAIGMRVGYRDDLGTTPTYTATTAATPATGLADFRVDARYIRSEINITGTFDKVTGFVVDADPSSGR